MIKYFLIALIISGIGWFFTVRRKKTFVDINNPNKWIVLSMKND